MPDDERTIAQLAAAFRQALADKRHDDGNEQPAEANRERGRDRDEDAVLVATGAALGDRESLPASDADAQD